MNITASDVIAAIAIVATIITTSAVAWIAHLDRKVISSSDPVGIRMELRSMVMGGIT